MSRKGWTCPVCGRGVNPDKDTCDHGQGSFISYPPTFIPASIPLDDGMCPACRNGGTCNCYRPDRGPFVIS